MVLHTALGHIYIYTIYGKLLRKRDISKLPVSHHPEERGFASLAPIIIIAM